MLVLLSISSHGRSFYTVGALVKMPRCTQLDDLHLVNYCINYVMTTQHYSTINIVLTFSVSISIVKCSLSYCVIWDTILKLLLRQKSTHTVCINCTVWYQRCGNLQLPKLLFNPATYISIVPELTLSSKQTGRPLQPMSHNKQAD